MSKPGLSIMADDDNISPPITSPHGKYYEEELRMASDPIKLAPFDKIKSTMDIIKSLSKAEILENIGKGARSEGHIIKLNNVKYILRKTPVPNNQVRTSLINEQLIYKILEQDPNYKKYISNLLYADVPLIHHHSDAYNNAYFIFEYQEGETLDKFIDSNKDKYSYEEIMNLISNINTALQFIYSRGIIHRDIKPDNIFIDKSRNNLPLIFDFDISCRNGIDCKASEFTGTRKYMTNSSKILINKSSPFLIYEYNHYYDLHSLAIIIEEDLVKLAKPEDKEKIVKYGQMLRNQLKMFGGKRMKERKTRKAKGGRRIGVLNPWWGGACPCPNLPKLPIPIEGYKPMGDYKPMVNYKPTGGYRPTKKNLKYLRLWKQGKSIGFTMRSSLKAKGLIPRANGTRRVSNKYR
jgi:serine/threonine protein kinase